MPALATRKSIRIAAVGLAAALALASCAQKAAESAKEQARSVSVVTVASREIQGGLAASGALVPREDVAIFPQITGYRVAKVLVDVGSWVRTGQTLVQLDDILLRAQLAQQEALAAQPRNPGRRGPGSSQPGRRPRQCRPAVQGADRSAAVRRQGGAGPGAGPGRGRQRCPHAARSLTVVRAPFGRLIIERNAFRRHTKQGDHSHLSLGARRSGWSWQPT